MTNSAVASRYAGALADVVTTGTANLTAENALAQLRAFEGAMKESADLANVLTTPAVPVGRKRAVVDRLVPLLNLSPITRNFIFVLIDKRRMALLGESSIASRPSPTSAWALSAPMSPPHSTSTRRSVRF